MLDNKIIIEHFNIFEKSSNYSTIEFTVTGTVASVMDENEAAVKHFEKAAAVARREGDENAATYKAWLPDGYSQILRSCVFGPSGLKDYGSATLRYKI